ncbi:MAG: HNH endonuclease [Planctomycetes bacterium]|nr:HNH endonuclease [Planctomycetota bacterium]
MSMYPSPRARKKTYVARSEPRSPTSEPRDGVRCSATNGLEIHHDEPFGLGGATTLSNLRLACRAHNLRMAETAHGAGAIQAARANRAQGTRN